MIMHRRFRSFLLTLSFLMAFVLLGSVVALTRGQQPAVVSVEPAHRYVGRQQTYTVTLSIAGVEDLGGFEFELSFDPTVLQVEGARLGAMLGSTGRTAVPVGPTIDNTSGRVNYGAFSFGDQSGAAGSGTLVFITYTTGITPGESMLVLQEVQVVQRNALPVVVQTVDATVEIVAGPRIKHVSYPVESASDESIAVTATIDNVATASGIVTATVHFGYTPPYSNYVVSGQRPAGDGNGEWQFTIPPQGIAHEGEILSFWLQAVDGDTLAGATVADNDGLFYSVVITPPRLAIAPLLTIRRGDAGQANLAWQHNSANNAYEVWRAPTAYFTPGEEMTEQKTVVYPGAEIGSGAWLSHSVTMTETAFYMVRARAGQSSIAVSNQVGVFGFSLKPGE